MKISLRPPCRECPFLKTAARGWLGSEKPETVFSHVHSDGEFGYPCHMDAVGVNQKDGRDPNDPDSVEQCVGAMLHAHKTAKRYDDKFKEAARTALAAVVGTDGILGMEFIEYHTLRPKKKRK